MSVTQAPTSRTVEARHTIDASPDEVFAAWVTAELIAAWWGPEGFTSVVRELDASEGGRFVFEMIGPDGVSSYTAGFYRELKRPDRLVMEFTEHCNADLPDGVEPQLEPSMVTVEFLKRGTRTEVVVTHAALLPAYSELATFGWSSSLGKLARTVARAMAR